MCLKNDVKEDVALYREGEDLQLEKEERQKNGLTLQSRVIRSQTLLFAVIMLPQKEVRL